MAGLHQSESIREKLQRACESAGPKRVRCKEMVMVLVPLHHCLVPEQHFVSPAE